MPIGSRDPYPSTHGQERSGSVVECLTSLETEGPRVRASSVSLCCVFEQGTFILAYYLFNTGSPDVTKISLSGT